MLPFFRPEVDTAQTSFEGRPLDINERSLRIGASATALFLLLLLVFISLAQYSPKRTVEGYTVSDRGLALVHAPFDAIVVERYVRPGEDVKGGQLLYRLAVPRSTAGYVDVGKGLVDKLDHRRRILIEKQSIETQRAALEVSTIEASVSDIREQLSLVERELQAMNEANQLRSSELERIAAMLENGSISRSRYDHERISLLEREAQKAALERVRLEVLARIQELQLRLKASDVNSRNTLTEIAEEMAIIEQDLLRTEASNSALVRAPVAGTVSSLVYEPGQQVRSDLPLLSLLPEGSVIQARLLVPSRAIGLIEQGQEVVLNYHAFPYRSYGSYTGTVSTITRSAIAAEQADLPIRVSEPVYLVTVLLDDQSVTANGSSFPLQTGMLLDADIVVGRMRLYEWILYPLSRLTGRT